MIWQRQWDDPSAFHDTLRAEILRRAATTDDFFEWPLVEVHELRVHVLEALMAVAPSRGAWEVRGWATVNRDGDYHKRYVRGSSVWSGIYYLDPGSDCACTVFQTLKEPIRITPVAGLMVVFPSTAWHNVEAHLGTGTRITIAFDAR
jgi:hypothetical protein